MKRVILVSCLIFISFSYAQPNCYIYPEGSGEKKACELSYKSNQYQQGSKEKQKLFDSIITIGPKYAWAYYQKSVPYFKRGFLHEGLQILNKAIELDPLEFLCYRAYWYWQYQNYKLCIQDLEAYYTLPKAYMQFTPGGEKDMKVILALSYAKLGNYEQGIKTISKLIHSYEDEDDFGLSDYHTHGMLFVYNKQYSKAIETLKKQLTINKDIADTYYFLGLAYNGVSDKTEATKQFNNALLKFNERTRYRNINAGFKVYKSDVENQITALKQTN